MVSRQPQKSKLRVPDHIVSLIRKSHPDIRKKIRAGLEYIQKDPQTGKSLKADLEGLKSYRVGKFRIIYRISTKNIIEIVAMGPRAAIYEETYRIIKKRDKIDK
jgi:mRNA interferase RelE/StbE